MTAEDFAARVRALMERLGILPFTPSPPDDAPTPPRPWSETDGKEDEG